MVTHVSDKHDAFIFKDEVSQVRKVTGFTGKMAVCYSKMSVTTYQILQCFYSKTTLQILALNSTLEMA